MGSGRLKATAPAPREYQTAIANAALRHGSTLVVLPTGLGKTLIAFLVMQEKLKDGPVLFLAPTKPLAAQHLKTAQEMLDLETDEMALVTGATTASKRKGIYPQQGSPARLIFSTPQTIRNDLEKGRLEWKFSLVVFDEVHRAVGKYAYARIAEEAKKHNTLCLGLTASPGGQKKKIEEMMALLGISHVQIRSHGDADVAKYVQPLTMNYVEVELPPELEEAKGTLREMIGEKMNTLRKMGFPSRFASKKGLAELRARILASRSGLRFSALSQHATLFSLVHCLELLETQGVQTLLNFVQRVRERAPTKAQARLLNDQRFASLMERMKTAGEHPKKARLLALMKEKLAQNPALKAIVFCQYRDQAMIVAKSLCEEGMRAFPFMGKKDGVTAASQKETLEKFRTGEFDILVATSIGEEGLDIPSVDIVVFYEPVPSEIRSIQRRGRAGRAKIGEAYVLVTKGTQDQGAFWASRRREEKMRRIVGRMAGKEGAPPAPAAYNRIGESGAGKKTADGEKTPGGRPQEKKPAEKSWKKRKPSSNSKQTLMSDFIQ